MFYLKLSGWIPEEKEIEFTHVYKLAFAQLPNSCTGYKFIQDPRKRGVYEVMTFWEKEEQADSFSASPAFVMLVGAASALGTLLLNEKGETRPYETNIISAERGDFQI